MWQRPCPSAVYTWDTATGPHPLEGWQDTHTFYTLDTWGAHVAATSSLHLVHLGHRPTCAVEALCLHFVYLGYLGPRGAPGLTPYTPWTPWVACGGSWSCTFYTLDTLARVTRCNRVAGILTTPQVQESLASIPNRDAILRAILESTSPLLTVLRVVPRNCVTPGSPGEAPPGRSKDCGSAGSPGEALGRPRKLRNCG